jgi:alkylated DNA repair dioxygenase AlkB
LKDRESQQLGLFGSSPELPEGLLYRPDFLTGDEERALASELETLPYRAFEFQGFLGKRRVVSFGWRYDFNQGGLKPAEPMPGFVLPLRDRAAALAGLDPEALQQLLVTEYPPGAGIGWHRDRSVFGDVIGVSLLSPCRLRFRRKVDGKWQRADLLAEPRSAYVLRGPARTEWEHSIPPLETLRYSLTFRSFRAQRGA